MNAIRLGFPASVLFFCVSAFAFQTPAAAPPTTYPQIVRVSLVQGDVRVSRGAESKKASGSAWEKAEVDLPLAAGYSLVTGAGRAEIEFEDASTVYLAENSVLEFNELSSTGGVPRTELGLLSGTLTLHAATRAVGERFSVVTPTDRVTVKYPDKSFLRIESFLDAIKVTSMGGTVFRVDHAAAFQVSQETTATFRNGRRIFAYRPADAQATGLAADGTTDLAAWDQWVLARVTARTEATDQAMKEAGLAEPIPGLAEMQGQGTFYPCPPYGTCWVPKNGWAGQASQADAAAMASQTVSVAALQQGGSKGGLQPVSQPGLKKTNFVVQDYYFPCSDIQTRSVYAVDPLTGRKKLVTSNLVAPSAFPYAWAVCHAGSWIHDRGHYAWVAGHRPHHHRPMHWVQAGKTVGYVPIHPLDAKGKPPVNLKDGIFHPVDKKGEEIEHLAYEPGKPLKLLTEPPKQFAHEPFESLARVDSPRLTAHLVAEGGRAQGEPITFDHKSQSFMVTRSAPAGGGKPVVQAIGGPAGGREGYAQTRASVGTTGGSSNAGGLKTYAPSAYSGGGASGAGAASHSSPAAASAPASSAPAASGTPATSSRSH